MHVIEMKVVPLSAIKVVLFSIKHQFHLPLLYDHNDGNQTYTNSGDLFR